MLAYQIWKIKNKILFEYKYIFYRKFSNKTSHELQLKLKLNNEELVNKN